MTLAEAQVVVKLGIYIVHNKRIELETGKPQVILHSYGTTILQKSINIMKTLLLQKQNHLRGVNYSLHSSFLLVRTATVSSGHLLPLKIHKVSKIQTSSYQ
jgi:hypothetical protein